MDFATVNWQEVLPKFGIESKFLKKSHGPCPLCAGRDRFRFDNKGNMGTWFCQNCGAGNAMTLLRRFTLAGDHAILKDIERYNGSVSTIETHIPRSVPLDEISPEDVIKNRKRLVDAWRNSVGISNDPVTTYLRWRVPGIDLSQLSREIRYHKAMKFMDVDDHDKIICRGTFPVMLARVIDGSGKPITLHRTYLTTAGRKAPFDMVKKQMGGVRKLKGAAIRLNEVKNCRTLGVCEGIETGLAIATAYRYRMPVWSLLNCTNLAVADIPKDQFDRVIIFADHDRIDPLRGFRPGEHYANLLQKKLDAEGFKAEVRKPPQEATDFADMWSGYFQNLARG